MAINITIEQLYKLKMHNYFKQLNTYSFVIILSTVLFLSSTASAEMSSVKGNKVNLRKGPGTKYSIIWEYGHGYPLQVVKKQGNWVKTRDFEKDTGWIHKSLLQYSPHVIVKVNKNNKGKINIRKGPGTSNAVVGKAEYGVVFKTIKRKSGWIKVSHDSGLTGWIKESLLWGY